MAVKAGVGFSKMIDGREAGREAARIAMDRGKLSTCDLVLFGATAPYDPVQLRQGIRDVVGSNARLFGGSAAGMITNDELGYDGYQVAAAVVSSDQFSINIFSSDHLNESEFEAGVYLAQKIQQIPDYENSPVLFMYDTFKKTSLEGGPVLNLATPLIEGMNSVLGIWPAVAGMGVVSDVRFMHHANLWHDDSIHRQSVQACVLTGNVRMETLILHGCKPTGTYHCITKAEGNVIMEIDGLPALDVIDRLLGKDPEVGWEQYPFFLTLGLNRGDKYADFKEENYANRLCLAVDPDRRALVMFEPDLQAGHEIQIMYRSVDFNYIGQRIQDFLSTVKGKPFLAVYIDCLGRAAALCGTEYEDAEEVQKHLGTIPLLGYYSGVEVAKIAGHVQALDWTGVLCIFTENSPS